MRTALGLLLTMIGAAVMLYGIGGALIELVSLYQGAMTDPLNQPEGAEKAVSDKMIRSAVIGAAGLPLLLIGGVLLKVSVFQRLGRRPSPHEARLARLKQEK